MAVLVSCGPKPIPGSYQLQFPPQPELRPELLGSCQWRVEYRGTEGGYRQITVTGSTQISVLQEWPTAVLAWPFWPELSLAAGHFNPAGAIFPHDAAGDTISLSWEAGAEAVFYRELENAQGLNEGTNRLPAYFDWRRFRTLIRENGFAALDGDPWLADWKDIAEKTVRSGFRQSYIRKEDRTDGTITIPCDGPWLSASPFKPPEFWAAGGEQTLSLSPRAEVWVCPGGKLSVSSNTWLWVPFPVR